MTRVHLTANKDQARGRKVQATSQVKEIIISRSRRSGQMSGTVSSAALDKAGNHPIERLRLGRQVQQSVAAIKADVLIKHMHVRCLFAFCLTLKVGAAVQCRRIRQAHAEARACTKNRSNAGKLNGLQQRREQAHLVLSSTLKAVTVWLSERSHKRE